MVTLGALAQPSKKTKDKEAIKSMCGCYEVTFQYAETFRNDTAYDFRDNFITGASAEWIFVDEETEDKIVIQHILVAQDTIVIKHWRQDWLFENQNFHTYLKNQHWQFQERYSKEVKGQWTQKVYQVDDGPRYEGTATWIHQDGKQYWEAWADAPLPRRERTKRDDYNVMVRRNRHQITDYGWVHEQDNKKMIRQNGQDSLLVMEKGYNKYRKINEDECKAAKEWWEENKDYWRMVRSVWQEIFDQENDLYFQKEINGTRRWEALFALQDEYKAQNRDAMRKKVMNTIEKYMRKGEGGNSPVKKDEASY